MNCIQRFINKIKRIFTKQKEIKTNNEETILNARQLMYSGSKLFVLFSHFNQQDIINTFIQSGQDILLVCGNGIDDVKGCYSIYHLLEQINSNKKIDILNPEPIKYISPNSEMMYVLSLLYNNKQSLIVVTNEFGGTEGVITKTSITHNIYDNYTANIIIENKNNNGAIILDGNTQLWKLKSILNINLDDFESDTVGGFVLEYFKDIPQIGNFFHFNDYIIKAVEIRNNIIIKVEIKKFNQDKFINN